MPLPFLPTTAAMAFRYAAATIAIYGMLKANGSLRRDQRTEDALDDIDEGLSTQRDPEATRAAWRTRRVFRMGDGGPGIAVDFSALARLRVRRL